MIKITFPDNSVREFNEGVTGYEIASSLSNSLAKEVLAITVNGEVLDLTRPITKDSTIKLHKWDDPQGKHAFWHSSAHLMAEALDALYPGVKFGIGPAIENGFYYDVDFGSISISDADLPKVEAKMKELAAARAAVGLLLVLRADKVATLFKFNTPDADDRGDAALDDDEAGEQ